ALLEANVGKRGPPGRLNRPVFSGRLLRAAQGAFLGLGKLLAEAQQVGERSEAGGEITSLAVPLEQPASLPELAFGFVEVTGEQVHGRGYEPGEPRVVLPAA